VKEIYKDAGLLTMKYRQLNLLRLQEPHRFMTNRCGLRSLIVDEGRSPADAENPLSHPYLQPKQDLGLLFSQYDQSFSLYKMSDADGARRERAVGYLTPMLAYPDTGSDFADYIGWRQKLFRQWNPARHLVADRFLDHLHDRYDMDAIILEPRDRDEGEEKVFGYTAFQVHGIDGIHVFGTEVLDCLYGLKLGAYMNLGVLRLAESLGIGNVRIGKGKNEHSERMISTLVDNADSLDIRLERQGDGWIRLLDVEERPRGHPLLHQFI
jgi:hypothetical protein